MRRLIYLHYRQLPTFFCTIILFISSIYGLEAQQGIIPSTKPATVVELDIPDMRNWLINAPMEDTEQASKSVIIIELPLPNDEGTIEVKAIESPILKGKAANKYSEIKSYRVYGIDDPTVYGRITLSPFGLHAYVTSTTMGNFYVEPNVQGVMGNLKHKVYYTKDGDRFVHVGKDNLHHDHGDGKLHTHEDLSKFMTTKIGNLTRTEYEVLFIADDTYYDFHRGGNAIGSAAADMAVADAIVAMTDGINVIYERDLGMRLISASVGPILFRSNPTVNGSPFFPDSRGDADVGLETFDAIVTNNTANDPSDNTTVNAAIVAATNLSNNAGIATGSFDVGHLLSAEGGGGSAYVGVSCGDYTINGIDPGKAGGGSATSNPTGSGWVELVAHEFGHQFGAEHSWNGGTNPCGTSEDGSIIADFCDAFGQYEAESGYEPGAGITLMSYAGICEQHNLLEYNTTTTASEIPFIHSKSIEAIREHINSVNCDDEVPTTNNAPNIILPNCTNNIPRGTPFELTGSATDADGNALTYSWEQLDLGAQGAPGIGGGTSAAAAGVGEDDFGCTDDDPPVVDMSDNLGITNTGAPTFRSYAPTTSPTRSFPRGDKVAAQRGNLSNTADRDGEVLPNYARTLTFRFTARDNNGALSYDDLTVTMDSNGPFEVTTPNVSSVMAGNTITVNWNANGFTACTNVNIKLTTDGGLTYPVTLGQAAFTNNTASITIPANSINTTNAHIRVECADNDCATFYNVSPAFEIVNSSMPNGSCSLPFSISCGDNNVSGNTSNGQNNITDYNLADPLTGPELIYEFQADAGPLTADLTGLSDDLDLILVTDCNNPSTTRIAAGTSASTSTESLSANLTGSGIYYLIVDGFDGATSAFNLALTCTGTSNCPTTLPVNNNPIPADTYSAVNTITSTGRVADGTVVTFEAGQSITLSPNFIAENGSTFTARIQACIALETENKVASRSIVTVNEVKIFPNPTYDFATVQIDLSQTSTVTTELFNQNGRVVKTLTANEVFSAGRQQLDIWTTDLPKGIYFIRVLTDQEQIIKKVILQ